MQKFLYTQGEQEIEDKLGVYVCQSCGRKHLIETLFKTYTNNKNLENVSVQFVKQVILK